ncbi:MFS transporter [Streptomyces sp. NPDC058231]|uniref:MFS transporter n=1 Tax=Streptomyces sp. NPDC058231 TaxID=3346392 RepID=UPI0036E62581
MNTTVRKLSERLLPHSAAGRTLAAGSFLDAFGSGLFLAVATLYFVGTVGITPAQVALALAVAGCLGLLSSAPGGRLADRVGVRPVYLSLLVLRGVSYGLYTVVDGFTGYLVVTCLATVFDRGCSPLTQAAVRQVVGVKDRNRTMAAIRALRNIGYTAGTLVAASVVAVHSRELIQLLFLANGLTFLITAWCSNRALTMARAPGRDVHGRTDTRETRSEKEGGPGTPDSPLPRVPSPFRSMPFMALTAGNALMCLHDTVLVVLLPVWVVHHPEIPLGAVPALLAANTALTVLAQVWISSLDLGRTLALGLLWTAAAALCAACLLFALAGGPAAPAGIFLVGAAVVLLTVGENLHAAASWYLSDAMAPPQAYARYLGAFTTSVTAHGLLGPALVLGVLFPLGAAGWGLLGALFTAGAGGMSLGAARATRKPVPALTRPAVPASD